MAKTYTVVNGFTLQADKTVVFGPGETIPAEYADHWYVQAQVADGNVKEGAVKDVPSESAAVVGNKDDRDARKTPPLNDGAAAGPDKAAKTDETPAKAQPSRA